MNKKQILKTLHQNKGEYVPGDKLASDAGISDLQLTEEIHKLEKDGYVIDSSSEDGYRLSKIPNRLLPYELQRDLPTRYIGREIHYYLEVDSTNEVAKRFAKDGAPEGTIVIAESQHSGRGRRGKKWLSPSGGVWMTIILRPDILPPKAPQLTLVTGVAVAETLKQECSLDVGIKWPNDILIGEKKVCGILTEAKTSPKGLEYVVVGVGIDLNVDVNAFPPELREGATSLKQELEKEIYSVELVQSFLENFEKLYNDFKNGKFPEILMEWRKHSKTIGAKVEVHKRGKVVRGQAVGITNEGILILEMDDGRLEKIISGECIHLK